MTTHDEQRIEAWLGLTLLPGWGPIRIWDALEKTCDPVSIWKRVKTAQASEQVKQQLAYSAKRNITIYTWDHPAYPANLREMKAPPPVIFTKGSYMPCDRAAVAIVGSRRCSPHALQLSFMLARDLASSGITVISGLASGVDAAAHKGALAAGGRTIAVMGCGADIVYPLAHTELASQIALSGSIISQFPCGTAAQRGHFPARNRILAGLALGTVVVEASNKSGALITAQFALDIGREVMVCPGDVLREHTKGSNCLLRDGARAVLDAGDIITELEQPLRRILETLGSGSTNLQPVRVGGMASLPLDLPTDDNKSIKGAPPVHTQVWEALRDKPCSADGLVVRTGLDSAYVRRAVTELEMLGYAARDNQGRYQHIEKKGKGSP